MSPKQTIDVTAERVVAIGVDSVKRALGITAEVLDGNEDLKLLGKPLLFALVIESKGDDRDAELASPDEKLDRRRASGVSEDRDPVADSGERLP